MLRSRQLSRTSRRTDARLYYHFLFGPQASPAASLEVSLGLLYAQAKYMRAQLNISKLFSMRVPRICANAYREARDRRRIDDFGFDFPEQVLGGTISQTKDMHAFPQVFTMRACSFQSVRAVCFPGRRQNYKRCKSVVLLLGIFVNSLDCILYPCSSLISISI